ncbi:hypothetical protein, partial [Thermophilibacter mediterraneus]|uniref:hypothetical protein n=1 Tax=Thermophilibacter mediterraneus TaxID=1871031 RepID=UPI00235636C8
MTACTNNGGSRARRAVTAALVGVLSVGAAPMVALATGAAPASGDVSLLATENAAFNGATIYYANGEDGASFVYDEDNSFQGLEPESFVYANTAEKIEKTFTYAKTPESAREGYHYFYVEIDQSESSTRFDNGNGENIVYTTEDGDVTLRGRKVEPDEDMQPGTYAVVSYYANGAAGYICATHADTFTVVNGGLEGATLYDGDDVNDTTFSYDGASADVDDVLDDMGVAVDGVKLPTTAYSITDIREKDTNVNLVGTGTDLKPGVTYVVTVAGIGNGYDGTSAKIEFTYGQLNLTNAEISGKDVAVGSAPATSDIKNIVWSIDGASSNTLDNSRFKVTVSEPENGVYTYTISSSDHDDQYGDYVDGSAQVKIAVGNDYATINYNGRNLAAWLLTLPNVDGFQTYTVDMTDDKPAFFDVTKLEAVHGSDDVDFTVSVSSLSDGSSADVSSLTSPGKWLVKVTANDVVDGQRYVNSTTFVVNNTYGVTDAANVFVSYDGKLVPSGQHIKDTYTGENLLDKLAITVKAGDKTFEEGADYNVEVTTKDQTGKTVHVDEVVDAGTYTVTIKGKSFSLNTTSGEGVYTFDVAKRELKTATPSNAFAVQGTTYYYSFTDDVIAPEFEFIGDDGETYTVPADQFEVTYDKLHDGLAAGVALEAKGQYAITGISLDADNFTGGPSFAGTIEVTDASSFVDVPNDAWYAEEVGIAKQ